jgi:hypothetical protein
LMNVSSSCWNTSETHRYHHLANFLLRILES